MIILCCDFVASLFRLPHSDQISYVPQPIRYPSRHRRSHSESAMNF